MLKSTLFFSSILLLLFGIYACDSSKEETRNDSSISEDYYDFKSFDLRPFQLNAVIMLPDETANIGASTIPEVKHEFEGFKWEIKVGPNYHLIIEDCGDNLRMLDIEKRRLKEIDVFKINYLIDTNDIIVYERTLIVDGIDDAPKDVGLTHASFHVYGQREIDGFNYIFKSADDGVTESIARLLAKSIRSVKVSN